MDDYDETKDDEVYDATAAAVVELGNTMMDKEGEDLSWTIASGLLAGAVQYWLYSRQPCDDPDCEDCAPYSTAELRQEELLEEVLGYVLSSEYLHSPNDRDVGRA